MDGNGRWAAARGLPRILGHRAGVGAARRIVEAAPLHRISTLTLFAFSCDNWRRPPEEVEALMRLLEWYLDNEVERCLENGVRIEVIGRRDRLGPDLAGAIASAERATAGLDRLRLRLAIDYSGRDSILAAARALFGARLGDGPPPGPGISRDIFESAIGPPVDLLIRTGGERRLSDFLLWECAYAELVFSRTMWPDFGPADLAGAVRDFHQRERRYGGIPQPVAPRREAWLD